MRILHTNDFHGTLTEEREEKLRVLRAECDFYFDCGDAVKSGNLAIPIRTEEVWARLARLNCTASVPGNRESHVIQAAFAKKIDGHKHPILCANLRLKSGERPFPGHLMLRLGELRVGVVAVMVPMVTEKMATQAASAYLWDPPIASAIAEADKIRNDVDCLIALTHIGFKRDQELATACQSFDLILGAHSHDVLVEPLVIGRTSICQTGSHGHFAGVYEWTQGQGLTSHRLVPIL